MTVFFTDKMKRGANDLRAIALEYRRRNTGFKSVCSRVVQNVADRVHAAFRELL